MTISQTSMAKPERNKVHKQQSDGLKVHFVAADLNFARALAGNNNTARERALKRLKEWFIKRSKVSPFTEDDFLRLWKGLFYSMWMSDKPLNQEGCAENISHLIHNFDTLENCLLFFKTGLITLQNEWLGIDQLRLDKFLMFVRRFLRQGLFALKRFKFNQKNIMEFSGVIEQTILNTTKTANLGLFMHFTEIFLEELAKVSNGTLNTNLVVVFLKPFIKKLAYTKDEREMKCIRKFVFSYLINQHDLGLEYREKYDAWRALGFSGSIDSIQKIIVENDELEESNNELIDNKEKVLDPRAGRVNVDLPQIKFNSRDIADALLEYKSDKNTTLFSRKTLTTLAENFSTLAKGVYPYGQKRVLPKNSENEKFDIRKSAKELIKFENKLLGKNKKKNRKRKLELVEENNDSDVLRPTKKSKIEEHTLKNKKTKDKQLSAKESVVDTKLLKNKKRKFEEIINKKTEEDKVDDKTTAKIAKTKPDRTTSVLKSNKQKLQHAEKKLKKNKKVKSNVLMIFERNSGTWVVTESETTNGQLAYASNVKSQLTSPRISPNNDVPPIITPNKDSQNSNICKDFTVTKLDNFETTKIVQKTNTNIDILSTPTAVGNQKSPKISPKLDNIKTRKKTVQKAQRNNIPRFDSLEDFLRHENEVRKRKRQGLLREINKKYEAENENSNKKHRANGEKTKPDVMSPIQNGVSPKKVRINTKLNTSQEIDEHIVQVMASPQIPFDSSKVPGKPLLKIPIICSPINPFFRMRKSSMF